MFRQEIEFSAHEDYFSLKEDYPTPIKLNIPEWFKKLPHTFDNKTVKGCMPFLDSLTSGYLLKMPQDLYIKHNVNNKNEKGDFKDCFQFNGLYNFQQENNENFINLNSTNREYHPVSQLQGSNLIEKNKNLPFHKILNPWKIKTPKGYSCLFVSPLNNSDDRFSIIPAIVDTDKHSLQINFPIVINGDKYPVLETLIKKGTPYVQIIPFKRDSWKMNLKPIEKKEIKRNFLKHGLNLLNMYKTNFWNKKSWN